MAARLLLLREYTLPLLLSSSRADKATMSVADRDLPLLVTRKFDDVDTWTILLVYLSSSALAVAVGFVASGRGRHWHKNVPRGLHRINWDTVFVQSQIIALITAIAQWLRATDDSICTCPVYNIGGQLVEICSAPGGKDCRGIAGATSLLFLLNLCFMAIYHWAYLTRAAHFRTAFLANLVLLGLSIAQLTISIVESSTSATIVQSIVIVFQLYTTFVLWRAMRDMRQYEADIRHDVERAESVRGSPTAMAPQSAGIAYADAKKDGAQHSMGRIGSRVPSAPSRSTLLTRPKQPQSRTRVASGRRYGLIADSSGSASAYDSAAEHSEYDYDTAAEDRSPSVWGGDSATASAHPARPQPDVLVDRSVSSLLA